MTIDDLDLSYSGLVDLIQSNQQTANDCLQVICKGIAEQNKQIEDLKAQLSIANNNNNYYKGGVDKIIKHMGIKPPFNFVFGDTIYAFSENGDFKTFEVTNKQSI